MKTILLAAAASVVLASAPAFAAEEFFQGPPLNPANQAPIADTAPGGQNAMVTTSQNHDLLINPRAASSEPQSVNSLPGPLTGY